MDEVTAIELLQGLTSDQEREDIAARLPLDLMETLLAAQARIADGREPEEGEAEAIKRVLLRLAFELEVIERDLLRFLKHESEVGRTWDQVAGEFGGLYSGKAGAYNRWDRLRDRKDVRRVTSRDMRRGAAVKGRRVVDSNTMEQQRHDGMED